MTLYERLDKVDELAGIDAKLSYIDALINKETNNFHENYMQKVILLNINRVYEDEIQNLINNKNIKLDDNIFQEKTLISLLKELKFSSERLTHIHLIMNTDYGFDGNYKIPQSIEKSDVFLMYIKWSKIAKAPYPFIKTNIGFNLYDKYKEKPDEFKYLGRINKVLQSFDDVSYMAYTNVCNIKFTYNVFLKITYGDKIFKLNNNIDAILDKISIKQEELNNLSYPEYFKSLENIFVEIISEDLEKNIEMDNDIDERDI